MERRNRGQPGREGRYLTGGGSEPVPHQVLAWQREVHRPGIYDLAVDTSMMTPGECAALIRKRLDAGPTTPTAFQRLAATARGSQPD